MATGDELTLPGQTSLSDVVRGGFPTTLLPSATQAAPTAVAPTMPPAPPVAPRPPATAPSPSPATAPRGRQISSDFEAKLREQHPELAPLWEDLGERREEIAEERQRRDLLERRSDEAREQYLTEARGLVTEGKARTQALLNEMPARPDQPLPAPLQLPEPPSRAIRPFGETKPGSSIWESVTNLANTLGLVAQMGVGISRGNAIGAQAAYAGAMQGWAQGAQTAAENDWLDYTARVGRMKTEHDSAMQKWRANWETYGHDLETLKAKQLILAAESRWDDAAIRLAGENPTALDARLHETSRYLEQLEKDTSSLTRTMLIQAGLTARHDQMTPYQEESLALRRAQGGNGSRGGRWVQDADGNVVFKSNRELLEAEPGAYAPAPKQPGPTRVANVPLTDPTTKTSWQRAVKQTVTGLSDTRPDGSPGLLSRSDPEHPEFVSVNGKRLRKTDLIARQFEREHPGYHATVVWDPEQKQFAITALTRDTTAPADESSE